MSLMDRFISVYGCLPTEFDPRYLEMLRMSKYGINDVPVGQPGKCANCGSSRKDGRMYVDIGLQVDWYGAVIFCTLCLTDIAKNAGLFNRLLSEIEFLKNRITSHDSLRTSVEEISVTLVTKMEEFKEHVAELRSTIDDISPDSSINVESESATGGKSGISPAELPANASESKSTKSTSSSRSTNFPSLASLVEQ